MSEVPYSGLCAFGTVVKEWRSQETVKFFFLPYNCLGPILPLFGCRLILWVCVGFWNKQTNTLLISWYMFTFCKWRMTWWEKPEAPDDMLRLFNGIETKLGLEWGSPDAKDVTHFDPSAMFYFHRADFCRYVRDVRWQNIKLSAVFKWFSVVWIMDAQLGRSWRWCEKKQ